MVTRIPDRVASFLKIQDALAGFFEGIWAVNIGVTLRRAANVIIGDRQSYQGARPRSNFDEARRVTCRGALELEAIVRFAFQKDFGKP
jgi:hypothetical protein